MPNGRVEYDKAGVDGSYLLDTVATFSCNDGYSLSGARTTSCQISGNWLHVTPTCQQSIRPF